MHWKMPKYVWQMLPYCPTKNKYEFNIDAHAILWKHVLTCVWLKRSKTRKRSMRSIASDSTARKQAPPLLKLKTKTNLFESGRKTRSPLYREWKQRISTNNPGTTRARIAPTQMYISGLNR